ncbi:MAG TPA: cbb3-type cytochrome oxidase assembly protein CcoS [Bacteroidetes bacterium]|nr:cbb3-type cytochrome oxidase assembly protein CcoS [Bacteroidota bacterium]
MSAMYMLIAFSLIIATGFVIAFIWAINSGQYDDKYTPSVRILFDDEPKSENVNPSKKNIEKKEDVALLKNEQQK